MLRPFPKYQVDPRHLPIGGCEYQITMPKERLLIAVTALLVCPHDHNYVVMQEPSSIFCSKLALGCLHDAHADF